MINVDLRVELLCVIVPLALFYFPKNNYFDFRVSNRKSQPYSDKILYISQKNGEVRPVSILNKLMSKQ